MPSTQTDRTRRPSQEQRIQLRKEGQNWATPLWRRHSCIWSNRDTKAPVLRLCMSPVKCQAYYKINFKLKEHFVFSLLCNTILQSNILRTAALEIASVWLGVSSGCFGGWVVDPLGARPRGPCAVLLMFVSRRGDSGSCGRVSTRVTWVAE